MKRLPWLQIIFHVFSLMPLTLLIWDALSGNLSVNPIADATQRLGRSAIYLLTASLACAPLSTLLGWPALLRGRRTLGLYAFLYATLHFIMFSAVDYGLNWRLLREAIFEKPYALAGFISGLILLALAATSFGSWWKTRLGRSWKYLHRLVYPAGLLAALHFAWARKGNLLTLRGDIQQPLLLGAVIILLLIARLPSVKQGLAAIGQKLRQTRSVGSR